MKRFVLVAALLLTTITAFAQNGKSIYQKYSDAEGVSAVYISPAMFRLIGKIPDLQIEGEDVNLAPIIKSLTGLYLIDSENPAINASLKADAEQFVKKGNYELLMEAKDSGETMRLFTIGTETIVNGFVMIADEGDETTFIFLDGKMNREELEKVIAESTKK
ncbi:MAG: DUF4252 domain-containing protein [Bacteroidales bacterium]|nr:DUF4252 domain-containing protein [Bacteroidales bacterium]MBQ6957503.1 DUF4252 domain-containing protein [Bacteroidales bacterium]